MHPKYKFNKADPVLGSKLIGTFLVKNNFMTLEVEERCPLSHDEQVPLMSRAVENMSFQEIYSEILHYTEGRRAR